MCKVRELCERVVHVCVCDKAVCEKVEFGKSVCVWLCVCVFCLTKLHVKKLCVEAGRGTGARSRECRTEEQEHHTMMQDDAG